MKITLLILLSFVALTACISGGLMIYSPTDGSIIQLPLFLLKNSPFKNYLVPGIILATVVGGVNLLALVLNIQQHPKRYSWAMVAGLILCGWIVVQMILLYMVSWLHFVYLGTGLLIMLIAYQLKGKWAA